jgi:hypothetical protein
MHCPAAKQLGIIAHGAFPVAFNACNNLRRKTKWQIAQNNFNFSPAGNWN